MKIKKKKEEEKIEGRHFGEAMKLYSSTAFSSSLLLMIICQLLLVFLCDGCLDEEKRALLDVRAAFDIPGLPSVLHSWAVSGQDQHNCCVWERVRCGARSGRVVGLDLGEARPVADLPESYPVEEYQEYTLNATLFLPFRELRRLNLSMNYIIGCFENAGLDKLKELSNLEFLDLSSNSFDDTVVHSLAAITSLKTLSLHDNSIGYDLPINGFKAWSKLSKMEYLDLSMNSLNETAIPPLVWIPSLKTLLIRKNPIGGNLPLEELSKLNLEVLDLSGNGFVGSIPELDKEWTSLKAISLSENNLNGTLPQGICKMKNLQELDLSQNNISGVIPACLGELISLRLFDVSDNHLHVYFPSDLFFNLSLLEYISLSNNQLEGTFSLSSLSNHSNLKLLDLEDDNNKLEVETESQVGTLSFQLEGLILSRCNLNKDTGSLPSFLSTQFALKLIDLSHNKLRGNIPNWLLENKTSLHYLNLQNNSLTGPFNLPSHPLNNASWIDLSKNNLTGELPINIGIICPNLVYLKLQENSFQGIIPSSFGYIKQLQSLDMSNNSLSGEITDNLLANWSSMVILRLSNNDFRGRIPFSSNLSLLTYLFLGGNHFIGTIPSSICNYSMLTILDLSRNNLSGRIPTCLGNLPQVSSLIVGENYLEGNIPDDFCNLSTIVFLDLSRNNLIGSIPSCLNLPNLKYLHLRDNGLTGSLPISLCSNVQITTIDITNNSLSGKFPKCPKGSLKNLRVLLLKRNQLEGSIPNQVCHLKNLRILDLSQNNIYGHIPSCLDNVGQGDGAPDSFEYHASYNGGEIPNLFPAYKGLLPEKAVLNDMYVNGVDEELFTTKSISYSFQGYNLKTMSGLDLSCNHLEGEIPTQMGNMSSLYALNLSNNHLIGQIPHTFSNLKDLESLDLSSNMLTGRIPRELLQLNFLEVFSVAYNNLSGPTLEQDAQFSTFDVSSYQGNPYLCGPPLKKNCISTPTKMPLPSYEGDGDEGGDATDRIIFIVSFIVALVMGFCGFMTVLNCKANWRHALFHSIDQCTEEFLNVMHKLLLWIKASQ